MASKTKEMRRQEEVIKRAIMSGCQRGVCNSYGESVLNEHGVLVAKRRKLGSGAKTFVLRKGKLVEK